MSTVSPSGTCTPSGASKIDPDQLRQSAAERTQDDDKAAAPRQIDDVVDVAKHDDNRVAVSAKADFGTSLDNSAPGQRVNIRA